jgi:hypothetical protein
LTEAVVLDGPAGWVFLAWVIVDGLANLGLTLLMYGAMFWFVRHLLWPQISAKYGTMSEPMPSARIMLRRLFCSHRNLSATKTRHGWYERRCHKCGHRPDEGKRREDQR